MRKTKSGAVSAPKNRVCPCQSRVGVGLDAVARRLGQDAACGVVGIGDRLAVRRGLCDGAGSGVRRPAVRSNGDRPQIRAVIIIHGLRGIVKSRPQDVKEPRFRTVLLLNFGYCF